MELSPDSTAPNGTLATLTILIGMIFLSGIVGTGAELLLLEHTEDNWQLVPLGLFAVAIPTFAWTVLAPARRSLRAFQAVMLLFIVAGFFGLYWHYEANVEFELEMYPSMSGFALFWKSLHGAMPALAPATMWLLGCLGLTYAFSRAHGVSAGEQKEEKK